MSFDNRSSTMDGNGSSNSEMQSPPLCKTGCGFYGSAEDGLCSQCYKEKVKRLQDNSPAPSSAPSRTSGTTAAAQTDATRSLSPSSSTSSSNINDTSNINEATGGTDAALKDVEKKPAPTDVAEAEPLSESVQLVTGEVEVKASASAAPTPADADAEKPKKNRCLTCNKKVGLTGFGCRCGGLFCGTHRYSDKHNCGFDYKELAQGQIRKNNPVVAGNKITKI